MIRNGWLGGKRMMIELNVDSSDKCVTIKSGDGRGVIYDLRLFRRDWRTENKDKIN